MLIDRWKKCVVNVEFGQPDSDPKDRKAGTAIFIVFRGKFFLVTAAHLVIDKRIASNKSTNSRIFRQMIRVPSLSELKDEEKRKIIDKNIFEENGKLMQQRAPPGIPFQHKGENIAIPKYIELSESIDPSDSAITIDEENDIAIISLRGRLGEMHKKMFWNEPILVEELLLLGYQPLSEDEIGQEPSQEGSDIFTVGYPSHISQIGTRENISGKYERFISTDITVPCFTFGKISMINPELPFFWGDLRVYFGNSGCPVVENDIMVGIVTHDAVIEENERINNVPFAKATKTKFLFPLIKEQILKDERFVDPSTLHIRFPKIFASPEHIAEVEKSLGALKMKAQKRVFPKSKS